MIDRIEQLEERLRASLNDNSEILSAYDDARIDLETWRMCAIVGWVIVAAFILAILIMP